MVKKILIISIFFSVAYCFAEKITLASVNWEPFTAEYLPYGGIMGEIAHKAFTDAGYELEIVFVPWNRAMQRGKTGQFDGLIGIYYTDERDKHFCFSKPLCNADISFFSLKNNPRVTLNEYESLNELDKYSIGVINGFSYGAEFDNKPFSHLEISDNMNINVHKLIDHRIDLLVESKENFLYFMHLNHPELTKQIVEIKPVLITNPAYIAISRQNKNHEEIIEAFNKSLNILIENGEYRKIMNKIDDYISKPEKHIKKRHDSN